MAIIFVDFIGGIATVSVVYSVHTVNSKDYWPMRLDHITVQNCRKYRYNLKTDIFIEFDLID